MTAEAAAAGRAKRPRQRVGPPVVEEANIERVYVWDIVIRLTHWTIALSILVLSVTGIYIGNPFITHSGPAGEHFTMGYMKIVHFYTAIVFSAAVVSRIIWMFIGPYHARWHRFIPVHPHRRRAMWGTFKFYTFLQPTPPLAIGHNPLAGMIYGLVYLLLVLMILTGLALYSVSAHVSYMKMWDFLLPIFGGPQTARWIHHIVMWLIIGFFCHHIWSAIIVARVEKNGVLDSIFSGYKFFPRERGHQDEYSDDE